ncbi:MAG: DUF1292 domain-containing protein [Christensenellales bacterium]|jgi:uncharacterized protein YrzB (UPF0473 family)
MSEDNVVILKDEDGRDVKFFHLMTFDFEDSFYVALTPEVEVDGIKNGEVLLLEIMEDEDGSDCYIPIQDDDQLDRVWEEFEKLYNEDEEE